MIATECWRCEIAPAMPGAMFCRSCGEEVLAATRDDTDEEVRARLARRDQITGGNE